MRFGSRRNATEGVLYSARWCIAPRSCTLLLNAIQRRPRPQDERLASDSRAGHEAVVELVLRQLDVLALTLDDRSVSVLAAKIDFAVGDERRRAKLAAQPLAPQLPAR